MRETKRGQRTDITKDNILETASRLFAVKGVANVAFDDIAKVAGYSRTTVYTHFSSKDDIVYSIALRTMVLVQEAMQKVVKQPVRADQQLRFLGYELINLCRERPFFYKCMLEYIDASPEGRAQNPILEEIYEVGEELNSVFAQIINTGVEQGVFRTGLLVAPTGLILWSCITSLVSLMQNKRRYIESEMLTIQEFYDYGFSLILSTVLSGGKAD